MALKRDLSSGVQSKVFDASSIFAQEAEDAKVISLFEIAAKQEIPVPEELSSMIATVNLINVKTLSPVVREKFQSLCGRLHTVNTNMMVDAIVDEAQNLKKSGISNPKDLEFLRTAIADIWENNSLSEVNSNLLRVASITLAQLTSGKKGDVVHSSDVNIAEEDEVLPESMVKGTTLSTDWEEAELAFELLDIASLFYQGKIREGLKMVKALPKGIKLPSISMASDANGIATFIQAAVIESFKIGRSDGYTPSAQEIEELLEEAASLS